MKKLLMILIAAMLCASPALAIETWYWDLDGTGYTAIGGTVVGTVGTQVYFPTDVTVSGSSDVTQSFLGGADDTILDEGDTFSDLGFLTVLSAGNLAVDPVEESPINFLYDGTTLGHAYVSFSGLEGVITDYDDGGTPTSDASGILDDTFTLEFDSGVGTIGFYLDTDLDPTNNNAEQRLLASLNLISGTGTSPFAVEGFLEGQFGLTAGFDSVLDDFWYFASGQEFDDDVNLNFIIAQSFNLGATFQSVSDITDGVLIEVANEGSFVINVVPEPSTFLLLGAGLVGLGFIARRRKQ